MDWQRQGQGTHHLSYSPSTHSTTVTDRRSFVTRIEYNSKGAAVKETVCTSGLRSGDPATYETSYQYNADESIKQITHPRGDSVRYRYDDYGNTESVTWVPVPGSVEPNITRTYTYTPGTNQIETMTGPTGKTMVVGYDPNGNIAHVTFPEVETPDGNACPEFNFTYNLHGQLELMRDPNDTYTKFEYYAANDTAGYGQLHKVRVDPNGLNITTEYKFDRLRRVIEVKGPNGATTTLQWNERDRISQITSPQNHVRQFSYNKNKMLKEVRRVLSGPDQIAKLDYDLMDKVKSVTDPLGNTTRLVRNKSEDVNSVVDAEGRVTRLEYDERDLLWKVIDANGVTAETYTYTPNGDVNSVTDAHGKKTVYGYDGFDRLTTITYPNDSNEVFTYDACSNITGVRNRRGQWIYYQYDELNRIKKKTAPEGVTTFMYDKAGRLVQVNDKGNLSQYTYDRLGRLTTTKDQFNRVVKYSYDSAGRRATMTYPGNTAFAVRYFYDSERRITDINDGSNSRIVHYGYDEAGRRSVAHYGNGTCATTEYDLANRTTRVRNYYAGSPAWERRFDYPSYDRVGNRLAMDVSVNDAYYSLNYQSSYRYCYDVLYQLTDANGPGAATDHFDYDAMGNRWREWAAATVLYWLSGTGLNQYGSVGGQAYTYDASGNLTCDGARRYYYDSENRLTDVNDMAGARMSRYRYDWLGRRVEVLTYNNGTTTTARYTYSGGNAIAEYSGTGSNPARRWVFGPHVDEPVCLQYGSGNLPASRYYYHKDGLGSVVAVSNNAGSVVETYKYDAFGNTTITGADEGPRSYLGTVVLGSHVYGFTGREYETRTGLYYYRARYYNPQIGRFLQTDPIGYYDSLNLYQYCGNNPVNWTDPWGLYGWHKHWGFVNNLVENVSEAVGDATNYAYKHIPFPDFTEVGDCYRMGQKLRNEFRGSGDASDAMRHAEWNRQMTDRSNSATAWMIGWGWEGQGLARQTWRWLRGGGQPWGEYWDDTSMDLYNNKVGREAGDKGCPLSQDDLNTGLGIGPDY